MRSQRSHSVRTRSVLTASCALEGAEMGSGSGAATAAGVDEGPVAGAEMDAGGGNGVGAPKP